MNESLHSLFLGQAIGLYLVIVAIIMVARANYYQELLTHLKTGSPTIVVTGVVGLILGIILVLVHHIWVFEPEVLITIVAWVVLIKSVLWLSFPECMVNFSQKFYSGWGYYVVPIIAAVIGVILMAYGFHLFRS